jgi:hypothetical protein
VLTGELNIGLHILDTVYLHGDQQAPHARVQAAFARALKVNLFLWLFIVRILSVSSSQVCKNIFLYRYVVVSVRFVSALFCVFLQNNIYKVTVVIFECTPLPVLGKLVSRWT